MGAGRMKSLGLARVSAEQGAQRTGLEPEGQARKWMLPGGPHDGRRRQRGAFTRNRRKAHSGLRPNGTTEGGALESSRQRHLPGPGADRSRL